MEGVGTVLVEVRDRAGNVFEANSSIILDMTPPEITMQLVDGEGMEEGSNEFLVHVWDEFDPSPSVWWRVDGGQWQTFEGTTITVDLDTGSHKVDVRAMDAGGNGSLVSIDGEVTTDYLVISGWLLLIGIIVSVAIYSIWRERRTYRERLKER